jgi:hypothetical protein
MLTEVFDLLLLPPDNAVEIRAWKYSAITSSHIHPLFLVYLTKLSVTQAISHRKIHDSE